MQSDHRDLAKSFEKLKIMTRKLEIIADLKISYLKQGYSPWMAHNLAVEKYRSMFKP